MYIRLKPKSREEYYFQKMLGSDAVVGTKYVKEATKLSYKEAIRIQSNLLRFIESELLEEYSDSDQLLHSF
ncbi:hypothetical protein [Mammaliicoccus lentus]|uniref:hypothetical protein n=1 Tax=Mammaliicoccus lentus TaxID=42858 RepID=UPI0010725F44|nr:hypothetical protein [Mammaliicoccus lentus]MBF0793370.1 hypothetical protein [Mammaliicoccus lentus]TFV17871.1 hypothetical protein E4T78_01805 [Mammaliicoccus lentus]